MNSQRHDETRPDPALERLLDAALGPDTVPGGIPPDLADRVVAATVARLPGRAGVLARIDRWPVRALAAALILAATIGIVYTARDIFRDVRTLRQIDREWLALQDWQQPFAEIDGEIEMVALQLDGLRGGASWDDALASLDDEIAKFEAQIDDGSALQF